ncbi:hypothetical protein [Microbacterium aquilitoris]|nr:hypothetical protein [Microbacterium sp. KSW2-22]MDT3343831.1 hypothetical protein [Microbacterium sp. KSW2-22]
MRRGRVEHRDTRTERVGRAVVVSRCVAGCTRSVALAVRIRQR